MLAKDPGAVVIGQTGKPAGQAKLGAWMLIALLIPLPVLGGCTGTTVAQAKRYLANPSAGTLTQMQVQVVVLQQQVNAAMLQAARIVNPASQQHALAAIQAVGTVVTAMLSLVQSVSSKQAVAQMAKASRVKMSAVLPLVNQRQVAEMVAAHYAEPVALAQMQVARVERMQMEAGF